MRARLAAELLRAGGPEQRTVPRPAPRVDRVVAEEVRFLGTAHEEARLPPQLLMQRGRGTLHRPDDDEVGSMDHHPDDSPGLRSHSIAMRSTAYQGFSVRPPTERTWSRRFFAILHLGGGR